MRCGWLMSLIVSLWQKVNFDSFLDQPLGQIREAIGLEVDLLKAYYQIEAKRYPHIPECNRNLIGF